jgi:hypothetical protein
LESLTGDGDGFDFDFFLVADLGFAGNGGVQ